MGDVKPEDPIESLRWTAGSTGPMISVHKDVLKGALNAYNAEKARADANECAIPTAVLEEANKRIAALEDENKQLRVALNAAREQLDAQVPQDAAESLPHLPRR